MSDIDDRDRDGQRPTDLVRACLDRARQYCRTDVPAVNHLVYAVEHLLAAHERLEERLDAYMRSSRPALSAARMHVPIGGGDMFWKRQQERKQRDRQARINARMEAEDAQMRAEDARVFSTLFVGDNSTQLDHERPVKRVQRKRRSKKTVRRK